MGRTKLGKITRRECQQVNVRVYPEVIAKLEQLEQASGLPRAQVIERLIRMASLALWKNIGAKDHQGQ